jgi:2-keto-3-deoxy-L-rhamnonate aldolase RhmA
MSTSIIPSNRMKLALDEGKSVFGTMVVEIRQPSVMQLLANAGFDFAIIDNEHGQFNIETIADLSRAARLVGITPIVRVPEIAYATITQPLDGGAQGLMIPRVTERREVEEALKMMKYPPIGRRESVTGRGHTDFKSGRIDEVTAEANRESFLIVQIETRQALERIDEIISVPGVDAALVGPTDLSVALGVPGQMNSTQLNEAIKSTIAACSRHRVVPALHMNEIDIAVAWAGRGMRILSFSSETSLLMRAGREIVSALRLASTKQSQVPA